MKKIIFLMVLLSLSLVTFSQVWKSDPANSRLGFKISSVLISHVSGSFRQFNVKVVINQPDYRDAKVEVVAQIGSINTNVEKRDKHLKSITFFDAVQFPTLKFISTSLKQVKDNKYMLKGNLTMHGVTKPVELDVYFSGKTLSQRTKKEIAVFKVTGHLNRAEFGIGRSYSNVIIGNDVTIIANLELNRAN